MTRHWYFIEFEDGETVGSFMKQFEHLPEGLAIPWSTLANLGATVFDNGEKDEDGHVRIRLPLIEESQCR
jgi:hypothetical protein